MNIGCYRESAEHFIHALEMHFGKGSDTIWDTLHRCFMLMERNDLAGLCSKRDISLFKEFQ